MYFAYFKVFYVLREIIEVINIAQINKLCFVYLKEFGGNLNKELKIDRRKTNDNWSVNPVSNIFSYFYR